MYAHVYIIVGATPLRILFTNGHFRYFTENDLHNEPAAPSSKQNYNVLTLIKHNWSIYICIVLNSLITLQFDLLQNIYCIGINGGVY